MTSACAGWRPAILVTVLGIAVVGGLVAAGVGGGALSAIAIGTGVAVAILSAGGSASCTPRFLRRRG
jgi:hypothetical protein